MDNGNKDILELESYHSPQLGGLITQLSEVINRINGIKRARMDRDTISKDVLSPNASQKIKEGIMPHYLTCYGVSDLINVMLHEVGIQSELGYFVTTKGLLHVVVMLEIEGQNYVIGWDKDTVHLTTLEKYNELFSKFNGDTLAGDIRSLNTQAEKSVVLNDFGEFMGRRVEYIIRKSNEPSSDDLINQKLRLVVDVEGGLDRFIFENGLDGTTRIEYIQALDDNGSGGDSNMLAMAVLRSIQEIGASNSQNATETVLKTAYNPSKQILFMD